MRLCACLLLYSAAAQAEPVAGFSNEPVLAGLNQPVDLAFLPDGRMLILQKPGEILIADPQANPPVTSTYMTLPDIDSDGERGLISIVLDPDFNTNNYLYLYYTKGSRQRFRVARFTHQGSTADPASEFLVWENPEPVVHCCHYGGGLDFGPDGLLYLTTGDAFEGANSQDLTRADGKILRFGKDGSIPTDNPYADGAGPNLEEIWAIGLRNPFRATWDLSSGRFYVAVVGGNVQGSAMETVSLGAAGVNYGWPYCEGAHCNNFPQYDTPFFTYSHSGSGASITGGFIYKGTAFPAAMQGAYFFADYVRQWIRYFTMDAQGNFIDVFDLDTNAGSVVALQEGPDGALYYLDIVGGSARRIVNQAANARPVITQASADDPAGTAPHDVTFTGAATDADDPALTYTWTFGDGNQAGGAVVSHQYADNGLYLARLSVTDGTHTVFSDEIEIMVGTPPTVSITSPVEGTLFRAAEFITYAGTGSDPDGELDASNFEWVIEFVHNDHTHPGESGVFGYGGTFRIDDSGHDFSDDTAYRFILTATDDDGLSATDSVMIYPDKINVTFDTTAPVDSILLDGVARQTPFVHDTVIGFNHEVSVPEETCIQTVRYLFDSWTDAGAATHIFTVPNADTNMTAMFSGDGPCERATEGLQVLYDFSSGSGTVVSDRSGLLPALDLNIGDPAAVSWLAAGGLSIAAPTVIATAGPATRLRDALQATGEVTLEAWVRAGDLDSLGFGPGRIMAYSQNGYPVGGNLVLGQELDQNADYAVRLRTSGTNQYGAPHFTSTGGTALNHVIYTRAASGQERLYVNGTQAGAATRTGNFSGWGDYALAIGNEPEAGRPWLGDIWLAAIYDRALTASDVVMNFAAGPLGGGSGTPTAPLILSPPADVTVAAGEQATFSVLATGAQPLVYQWERDGTPLPGETGSSLVLSDVSVADSGAQLRCMVSNGQGSVTSAAALLTVTPPAGIAVPQVAGQTQAAAESTLTAAGLVTGSVTTQASSEVPSGNVISHSPAAGQSVLPGSAVDLVVSSGPAPAFVPAVTGMNMAAAATALTNAGLVQGIVTAESSGLMPAGQVLSQNPPAGAAVPSGSPVALVLSAGPAPGELRIVVPVWSEKPQTAAPINRQAPGMAPAAPSAAPTVRLPLIESADLIRDNPLDEIANSAGGTLVQAPDGEQALHVNAAQSAGYPAWDSTRSIGLDQDDWTLFLDLDIIGTVGDWPALIAQRNGLTPGYWQLNRVASGPDVNFAWNASGDFRSVVFPGGWPGPGRHQVVLTRENGHYAYYLDGALIGQATDSNPVPGVSGTHALALGILQQAQPGTNLLEARYHNAWINGHRAVTASEVEALAANPWQIYAQRNLADGTVGQAYASHVFAVSGGTGPYTWSLNAGTLPPGLLLSAAGVISGTPQTSSVMPYEFTVRVTSADGQTATEAFAISVDTLPLELSMGYAPGQATSGQFYWWDGLLPAGGQPPYTFELIGGWLPFPLALNADTGVISGMPGGAETAWFTIQVTDAGGATAQVQSQLSVKSAAYVCGSCHN